MRDHTNQDCRAGCDTSKVGSPVPMQRRCPFIQCFEEQVMGKYFLGWVLGVPAIVLVAIYLFMN